MPIRVLLDKINLNQYLVPGPSQYEVSICHVFRVTSIRFSRGFLLCRFTWQKHERIIIDCWTNSHIHHNNLASGNYISLANGVLPLLSSSVISHRTHSIISNLCFPAVVFEDGSLTELDHHVVIIHYHSAEEIKEVCSLPGSQVAIREGGKWEYSTFWAWPPDRKLHV